MTKQWLVAKTLWRGPRVREWSWKEELAPETPAARRDTHWPGHKNEPLANVGRPSGFAQIHSL